jgi:hypothetical protein
MVLGWQGTDKIVYEIENSVKINLKVLMQNTVQSWVGLPVWKTSDSMKDEKQVGQLIAFQEGS